MDNQYVEYRDEGYWIRGTRISLDSIVYAFRDGLSPETIVRDCFPSLSLEEVYGATAYYLGHLSEIDAYLLGVKAKAEQLRHSRQQLIERAGHQFLQATVTVIDKSKQRIQSYFVTDHGLVAELTKSFSLIQCRRKSWRLPLRKHS